MTVRRCAVLATGMILVASTASACGDSPTDASPSDFCDAITAVANAYGAVGNSPTEDQIQDVKDAVADLVDVGTPDGISDEARAGFELTTDEIATLDDNATAQDLSSVGEDFDGDDGEKADAFDSFVEDTCAGVAAAPNHIRPLTH